MRKYIDTIPKRDKTKSAHVRKDLLYLLEDIFISGRIEHWSRSTASRVKDEMVNVPDWIEATIGANLDRPFETARLVGELFCHWWLENYALKATSEEVEDELLDFNPT